jgi:uncharacterized protein YjbI with pentapeptide repeats
MNNLNSKLRIFKNWSKTHWIQLLSGSIITLLLFFFISNKWYQAEWTGFGKDSTISEEKTLRNGELTVTKRITQYQSGKTLWDWLGLGGVIAIPFFLFVLQQQQQKIADTNLREEALRDYIDKMAELLIDKELKILLKQLLDGTITRDDLKLDAVLDIARARTLSILRRLEGDRERKGSLVRFLADAQLTKGLDLLKDTNLSGTLLRETILFKANLSKVNLSEADLSEAFLSEAFFIEANLSGANLHKANFHKANLHKANLHKAKLPEADLSEAQLFGANFSKANLSGARLFRAFLIEADFSKANLSGAFLVEATNLSGAKFVKANLKGANFQGAKNLTPEQIKRAKYWDKAKYDSDFRKQLGLPPENTP